MREAVANGVNHINTAYFYRPQVSNQIIRKALSPYPDNLVIVTKISVRRGDDGSWLPAFSPDELTRGGFMTISVIWVWMCSTWVNLRCVFNVNEPAEGSIEPQGFTVLAELQQKGLLRHIGLSNVTPAQIVEAQEITPIVCVQNMYNLAFLEPTMP